MCGPLQAVVMGQWLQSKRRGNWLLYHAGRLGMYLLMALVVSFIGHSFGIPDLQGSFTIIAGLLLIFGYFGIKALKWDRKSLALFGPVLGKMQQKIRGRKSPLWYTMSGALNGLLPCGMVYCRPGSNLRLGAENGCLALYARFRPGHSSTFIGLQLFPPMPCSCALDPISIASFL